MPYIWAKNWEKMKWAQRRDQWPVPEEEIFNLRTVDSSFSQLSLLDLLMLESEPPEGSVSANPLSVGSFPGTPSPVFSIALFVSSTPLPQASAKRLILRLSGFCHHILS